MCCRRWGRPGCPSYRRIDGGRVVAGVARERGLPDLYGDAYEPRLPWLPKRLVELDTAWLSRWRDDLAVTVASAMATLEARMGYPPGDNRSTARWLWAISGDRRVGAGPSVGPGAVQPGRRRGEACRHRQWLVRAGSARSSADQLAVQRGRCVVRIRRRGDDLRGPHGEGRAGASDSRGRRDRTRRLRWRAGRGVRAARARLPCWSARRSETVRPVRRDCRPVSHRSWFVASYGRVLAAAAALTPGVVRLARRVRRARCRCPCSAAKDPPTGFRPRRPGSLQSPRRGRVPSR